jgi:hypothetical protein
MADARPIAPKESSVGIFWAVPDDTGRLMLVLDRTSLAEAEPYGDCLTHPRGHYEAWEAWRELGSAGLTRRTLPTVIAWHEYEHFPRGRIVYCGPDQRFIIYAGHTLHRPAFIARIVTVFAIPWDACKVQADPHYQTR